jgi:SAM-dependent methyltransferase
VTKTFADLGAIPLVNRYLPAEELLDPEIFYPLVVMVCDECLLVQLAATVDPAVLFADYAYFSSYSTTWREHCDRYAEEVIQRFSLPPTSLVVEAASNDGCLLRCFKDRGFPVLGVEPARNVAEVAEAEGIPTRVRYFGAEVAAEMVREGIQAELFVANNVLAHVPDLNGFIEGIRRILAPGGLATMEFPHVLRLMESGEFDTIYHEHVFYFSLFTIQRVFRSRGLEVVHVEELATHGGSLRIYVHHRGDRLHPVEPSVGSVLSKEREAGLHGTESYQAFAARPPATKRTILRGLLELEASGATVVGYGAPAKGNVLLNYCGLGRTFLPYTVDRSPHKQGLHLPGTRIPVLSPEVISETRPDFVLILPWNLKDEIMEQMSYIREWGGRFVIPIPEFEVLS